MEKLYIIKNYYDEYHVWIKTDSSIVDFIITENEYLGFIRTMSILGYVETSYEFYKEDK